MLRADHAGGRDTARPFPVRTGPMAEPAQVPRPDRRRRKGKTRKGFGRRMLEEAFDLIEDILD
jgi:hypothetical protein